jgi:hypothetical protein
MTKAFYFLASVSFLLNSRAADVQPVFAQSPPTVYALAGTRYELSIPLSQGNNLRCQWYRLLGVSGQELAGATNLTLTFTNVTDADRGSYELYVANHQGYASRVVEFIPVVTPSFVRPLGGYEGPEGTRIELSVTAALRRGDQLTRIDWYKDGTLMPATPNTLVTNRSFEVNSSTIGTYLAVVENAMGFATSPPSPVAIRQISPAPLRWSLVADTNTLVPNRGTNRFTFFKDAKIRSGNVTFLGSIHGTNEMDGLYHWRDGVLKKIADTNDVLSPSTKPPSRFIAASEMVDGRIVFSVWPSTQVASTDATAVFRWENNATESIATVGMPFPGLEGLTLEQFSSVVLSGPRLAFHAFEFHLNDRAFIRTRGLFVQDGAILTNWIDAAKMSAAGLFLNDYFWDDTEREFDFDGSTLAFHVGSAYPAGHYTEGIAKCVDGGPLQKILMAGDTLPGGIGTLKEVKPPPVVQDGKVLFLAEANEFEGGLLIESSTAGLRVITKAGDPVSGSVPFERLQPYIDYTSDGGILFSASGPGQKQGIYLWKNGIVTEVITTLHSIDGQRITNAYLADANGPEKLAYLGFGDGAVGLYALQIPRLAFSATTSTITMQRAINDVFQQSSDLINWSDLNIEGSSLIVSPSENTAKFYRLIHRNQ